MRSIKALVRPARQMTTHSGPRKLPPASPEFKAKQEFFQMDNGVLVHLKKGPTDRFFYYHLMFLIGGGLVACLAMDYKMAFPQKPT